MAGHAGSTGGVQRIRHVHSELPALRLGKLAGVHPLLDDVQLGLADRALEPERESVVVVGRIVDAVEIAQQLMMPT